jgi:hypothetical protein
MDSVELFFFRVNLNWQSICNPGQNEIIYETFFYLTIDEPSNPW